MYNSTPMSFLHPFNLCFSYRLKQDWNAEVGSYKSEVYSFERTNSNNRGSSFFGSEMPQIGEMTNKAVYQIFTNVYDLNKQSFAFKPKFVDDSVDLNDLQQSFENMGIFIASKLNDQDISNFQTTIIQHIEDSFIFGMGASLITEHNNNLYFTSLKPENIEFDVSHVTAQPNVYYIMKYIEFERSKLTSINTYNNVGFMGDEGDTLFNAEFYRILENTDGTWSTETWIHPSNDEYYKDNIDYYSHKFGNAVYYKKVTGDSVTKYCPVLMTRCNMKSNEVIGKGKGLVNLSSIVEAKNLFNAMRDIAYYETTKPLLTTETNMAEMNDPNARQNRVPLNEKLTAPVVVLKEVMGEVQQGFTPLERNLTTATVEKLLYMIKQNLTSAFDINVNLNLPINKEMTATETDVRDDKDKTYMDIYVGFFKQTFNKLFRVMFEFYEGEYRRMSKDDNLKTWVKYSFNPTKLEVYYRTGNEHAEIQEQIQDLSQMVDLETKIASMFQQLGLKSDQIMKKLQEYSNRVGVGELSIAGVNANYQPNNISDGSTGLMRSGI